jgi:outer membrane protein
LEFWNHKLYICNYLTPKKFIIVKNVSLALNGILLVAVAVLYFLHFSSAKSGVSESPDSPLPAGTLPVAYIDSDSLLTNYKMVDDLQSALDEKKSKMEKDLQGKGAKLQEEIASFQRRAQANLLSNNELKNGEESLTQKRDALMTYEKQLSSGLMEEQKLISIRLYDSLQSFLKTYNKGNKYKYILNYTKGGAFLAVDNQLDITKDVIDGMNKRYKENNGGENKDKK